MKLSYKFLVGVTTLFFLIYLIWSLGSFLVVSKPLNNANLVYIMAGSADQVERVKEAARLYSAGGVRKVILSNDRIQGGWDDGLKRNPFFVEHARWFLIENGVPSQSIEILPNEINGTKDEAEAVIRTICDSPENKVVVVTSAYHTRRTLIIFESVAKICEKKIEVGILHPEDGLTGYNKFLWVVKPTLVNKVVSEYVKLIAFTFS